MENPTRDLTKFGNRELKIAGQLLQQYAENSTNFLTHGVEVWFNMNSGYVFLSDEEYNVGVLNRNCTKIIQFYSCPECGKEGTEEDDIICINCGYCKEHCQCKIVND